MTSDWRRGGVLYQIYPRSFRDSDGDGVGDLRGATEKLDHVASLGVDGIWLSPFFASPMKDFGYDVSDYTAVDPLFGTLADFDALLARAHRLGLKVIIDQVYAHSSDAHAWFAESRESLGNDKADWYVWADAKPDGSPPNNWQALFGGPAWTWDARRRQYYLHNFLPSQPQLNVRNVVVQDALLDAARFWLDRGVDGFRLDVANFYGHDPLLRDNPPIPFTRPPARPHQMQRHLYSRSQPEALQFISRLRALTDAYEDRFLVGEIEDEDALTRQREYTDGPTRLHSAYSFFLLRARDATPALFAEALSGWENAQGAPAWSFSNHDVARMATRLAGGDAARAQMLIALLLCVPGVIILYQGEELGLPQGDVPFERLRDPEAIAFWPKGIGRDGARTPMPWAKDAPMAGFTSANDAWLPLDPRHRALAVDTSPPMLSVVREWIALRRAQPALRDGAWRLERADERVLAFTRSAGGETVRCVFNLGADAARCDLAGAVIGSIGNASADALAPNSGVVLRV